MEGDLGKIGLVGPGAIGGYYGGMLANAGQDIHFLFRSTYEDVRREGLTLIPVSYTHLTLPTICSV